MTKIYIYCLFDRLDSFLGVYSSLQAVHRDALRLCNRGATPVYMRNGDSFLSPTLKDLRNTFKGQCDCEVQYQSDKQLVKIYKNRIKE